MTSPSSARVKVRSLCECESTLPPRIAPPRWSVRTFKSVCAGASLIIHRPEFRPLLIFDRWKACFNSLASHSQMYHLWDPFQLWAWVVTIRFRHTKLVCQLTMTLWGSCTWSGRALGTAFHPTVPSLHAATAANSDALTPGGDRKCARFFRLTPKG